MLIRPVLKISLICLLAYIVSCGPSTHNPFDRHPGIFRVNLDNIPRVLVVALHPDLWAAYDIQQTKLYKTWKGGINFNGPMYDDRHNVQPSTRGITYSIDTTTHHSWLITTSGNTTVAKADYLGYRNINNETHILYRITNGNAEFEVTETPLVRNNKGNTIEFVRRFQLTKFSGNGVLTFQSIFTGARENLSVVGSDFRFAAEHPQLVNVQLSDNSATEIVTRFTRAILPEKQKAVENENQTQTQNTLTSSSADKGEHLISLNDCGACHNINTRAIGPSYNMIAERYADDPATIKRLSEKIINGGTGVWGRQTMTPHPQLSMDHAASMVNYILSLDSGKTNQQLSGLAANFYKPSIQLNRIPQFVPGQQPNLSVSVPDIEFVGVDMSVNRETNDFFGFDDQFVMHLSGYLHSDVAGKFNFRLKANAGARVFLNGKKIAEVNYSNYDYQEQEVTADVKKGANAIRVEYYEDIYSANLSLRWKKPGTKEFSKIPPELFTHEPSDIQATSDGLKEVFELNVPGFGRIVDGVHPSFDVETVRPQGFDRRLSDLEFLPDNRLAVSTWDSTGSIYIIDGVLGKDRSKMKATLFATGLYEVMGLEYVNGKLYALQKWELTELNDTDGDGRADEYKAVLDDWTASANFHEWAFGLLYRDGFFYFNTGIALGGNGVLTDSGVVYVPTIQTKDRGKTIKVNAANWTFEALNHGYKAPNGIGFGVDDEIFSTDNEGHMVPTNKLMHVPKQGYPFNGNDEVLKQFSLPVPAFKPPVVWMPTAEVSNSPSQPVKFTLGKYQDGQMIFGDVHHGGLQRVYVEKVNGDYQGAIFRFSQGLEAGINRIVKGPDGNMYMAGLGAGGDFGHNGECCGLQRLSYNNKPSLDLLSVSARKNGMMLEFTEPLRSGDGDFAADYTVQQFWYETGEHVAEGGVKNDIQNLQVKSVNVSADRKKIFLELKGMKQEHVVYVKINRPFISKNKNRLWAGEAWYTLNNVPEELEPPGKLLNRKNNQLLAEEKNEGWKLLFDGTTIAEWQTTAQPGEHWKINDQYLTGMAPGALLLTKQQYENFELEFEWKASDGGDAGVYFHVPSSSAIHSLPEMQLIDEGDSLSDATHLSGSVFNLQAAKYKLYKHGEFNQSRLIVNDTRLEYWLNGTIVAAYNMNDPNWKEKWKNKFGADPIISGKGHIAFAVQKQSVQFRNIRIRENTSSPSN